MSTPGPSRWKLCEADLSSTFSAYVPAFTLSASPPFCDTSIVKPGPVSPSSVPDAELESPPASVVVLVPSLEEELLPPQAAAPNASRRPTAKIDALRIIRPPSLEALGEIRPQAQTVCSTRGGAASLRA